MKHSHTKKPNRLQSRQCDRCKFDEREQSLEDKIKSMNDTDTTKNKVGGVTKTYSFQKLTVTRGHLDDVIGWNIFWS